jgi:3-oxoacyl-[acyl-carrier protein] reductase
MSDMLLNPVARRLVGALGLPLPMPAPLRRDGGPWQERSLSGLITVIGSDPAASCLGAIAVGLAPAGAVPYLALPDARRADYRVPETKRPLEIAGAKKDPEAPAPEAGAGKTRGAPALDALGDVAKVDALVFDATGLADVSSLRSLYDFFHALVPRLEPCARIVVVARPEAEAESAEGAAASAAIEGFVRSLAKEIGRTGARANLVRVERGAERRLAGALRFLLSARASFVTAQPLLVTSRARAASSDPLALPFEKKIALVTGAARGIGEVTARLLAREGAHVVCVDHPDGGASVTELAKAIGGTALLADITDATAPGRVADVLGGLGGVDIVVHNAGITRDKTLGRMAPDAWDAVLGVNLGAAIGLQRGLEGALRDEGRVVCLSSVAGLAGNVGQTAYAASKAGIAAWARREADRLAPRGITVNAIAPGFIETRLTAAIPFAIREAARRLSALAQGGQPEDVANAIVFLASPGAHGITGATLRVCGGALVGA